MVASAFIIVIALAQAALAQTVSAPPGTPPCLITCSNQYCPGSNIQCICEQQLANITSCVLANCSGSDLTAAESLAPQLCPASLTASGSATATAMSTVSVSSGPAGSATTSSVNSVSSASSALSSASSALSSASSALASASSVSASQSSAAASASSSSSAASSHGHGNTLVGAVVLCLAGVAAGFALY